MNQRLIIVLLRRLLSSLVVLFLLISFVFVLIRLAPGDPAQKFISPELSKELAENVRASFGLDSPIHTQYVKFVRNIFACDLGVSYNYRIPVLNVIFDHLPFTIIFASLSFFIQILVGFWLAVSTFKKMNSLYDRSIGKLSLIVYSTPAYVLGIVLIYLLSLKLKIFPSSDLQSFDFNELNFFGKLLDYASHMALPLATLSLAGVVIFYRYLRDNLDNIQNKMFVTNLRAMGVGEKTILYKHIIPNALGPMISVAGIELGVLFSGALITEVIFGLPGMGRLTVSAIMLRDYPLVVGCSFISGVLVIITNFVADVIKVIIDKRLIKGMLN